ncbi:TetR/AcrR family transcriptional regulator [Noviherbaspirillum sp. Root189]|uniref:TetR/AcrR family transcriptional regulator n=1 Tax=Noviherbaspirillum sp. Root189 TaxID=1736487 RepID=UPI00070D326F|nr:TetR/AcrR family transcriptional regulator [Noviherbaspirillum sp. Root189]KRB87064.1 TetR family transcriptional regulator [Noviherbaspirillum sp. Root189]
MTSRKAPASTTATPSETSTASPWKKTRDVAKEREEKRDAVLRTAAQMFNEKGFHATSLDEVAERLHITKPTLYYYVKNKDDILFQCVSRGLALLQDAIRVVGQSGGTAEDKLYAAMRQYAEIVTMDFGMCVIRVGEDPLPLESRKKLRSMKGAIDTEFRQLIEQGIAEGTMAPCDPKMAAFTIAGALSWIGRWYSPDGPMHPDDIATQVINLLSFGISRRRAEERSAVVRPAASAPARKRPRKAGTI